MVLSVRDHRVCLVWLPFLHLGRRDSWFYVLCRFLLGMGIASVLGFPFLTLMIPGMALLTQKWSPVADYAAKAAAGG